MKSCRSTAEKSCWNWYTDEITDCKNPGDNLKKFFTLSEDWSVEPHLWETFSFTLLDERNLDDMKIPLGPSDYCTKALHLTWTIVARRGWTMSKHSLPPDAYAKILVPDTFANAAAIKAAVAATIRRHHTNVLNLEHAMSVESRALRDDCLGLQTTAIRLVWEFFRRDRYHHGAPLGRQLLIGLLGTLPDNKIAEDIHADLRLASKGARNLKMSKSNIQDIINTSTVIENRDIDHPTAITEDSNAARSSGYHNLSFCQGGYMSSQQFGNISV